MMMISTRGRYALRVLLDLAQYAGPRYVPMREVANRQEVSLKYLERILPILVQNGLVEAAPGRRGGYRLARKPADCNIGEILRLTEGTLAPVACLQGGNECHRAPDCLTLPMWKKFDALANSFFDALSIADLLKSGDGNSVAQSK